MRTASFRKAERGRPVAQGYSLPAPVGGVNARDSIAAMGELDAIDLTNMFPETNDVRVRRGIANHVTGVGNQVESLMVYNEPDGTQTMFGAANDSIYNMTSAGAVGAAVQGSLNSARWQHVNFTNSGGTSYLCNFNGSDSPRYWDGSSWTTVTGASSPAITGITTSTIISATVHKRRMWLVVVDSLTAYYLPVDSVGGAVSPLDLGGIASKGGYIMAAETWTIDAGEGLDDHLVFVTSEGQVVVYRGTNPSSSTTWAHVGTWNIGEPIGRRCLKQYEGDLLVITVGGVVSLNKVFVSGQVDERARITDKITNEIKSLAESYKGNFGWELLHFPQQNMLLLNIPVAENNNQIQYAMNTITGAWGGPFENIEANCWAILNKEAYFGGNAIVGKFWDSDNDVGKNIKFDQQQAYSWLGRRGVMKQVKSIKPYIAASGDFEILLGINVDFTKGTTLGSVSFSAPTYASWDSAIWDSGIWGSDLTYFGGWQNVAGVGSAIALRMKGSISNVQLRYQASDLVFEAGGVMG